MTAADAEVGSTHQPTVRGIYYPGSGTYEDLNALRAERDALVAQHDRDVAEIAELRRRVAAGAYTFDAYLQAKGLHDVLGAKGTETTVEAARRVVAERDEARQMLALAEGVAAELPTPDAGNPAHLRWAADMIELSRPGGDLACRARPRTVLADDLRGRADYLEAEAAEKSQREADAEDAERQLREDIAAMTRAGEGHVDVDAIIRRVREADKG